MIVFYRLIFINKKQMGINRKVDKDPMAKTEPTKKVQKPKKPLQPIEDE